MGSQMLCMLCLSLDERGFIMSPEMLASIKELITVIGFPIVCVIFMWRKITDSDEKQTALLTELTIAIKNLTDYIKDKKGDNK